MNAPCTILKNISEVIPETWWSVAVAFFNWVNDVDRSLSTPMTSSSPITKSCQMCEIWRHWKPYVKKRATWDTIISKYRSHYCCDRSSDVRRRSILHDCYVMEHLASFASEGWLYSLKHCCCQRNSFKYTLYHRSFPRRKKNNDFSTMHANSVLYLYSLKALRISRLSQKQFQMYPRWFHLRKNELFFKNARESSLDQKWGGASGAHVPCAILEGGVKWEPYGAVLFVAI